MLIVVLIICACFLLGALAAFLFHITKHRDPICYISTCESEATWVWRINGKEEYICDWHNAQLQTEYRGSGPIRHEGDR